MMEQCKNCLWFGYEGSPENCNNKNSQFFDTIVDANDWCDEYEDMEDSR